MKFVWATWQQQYLRRSGRTLWGFRPNLMEDIVDIHGSRKSLSWFAKNMPRYEKILKTWGAERTHLMAVAISGINGCPYCTFGHALSFQLHYFKNRNSLFPVNETEMMNFNTKTEQQVFEALKNAYISTGLTVEHNDLARLMELKSSPELATTLDDHNINHLVQMFAFLNSCGINKNTSPDHAHDPINKQTQLVNDYKAARVAQNE